MVVVLPEVLAEVLVAFPEVLVAFPEVLVALPEVLPEVVPHH